MRIGLDISQTGRGRAGCGCYAESLARALIEHAPEHQFVLFPSFGTFTFDPDLQDQRDFSGEHVRYGPRHRTHHEAAAFWTAPGVEDHLDELEVIHANNYWCPTQPLRARVVYTLHDLSFWQCPEWHTNDNRLACSAGVSNAAAYADQVVAISHATKKHFLQCFPTFPADRIEVIYPLARFGAASAGVAPRSLKLEPRRFWLSVGTLQPRKNHKRVIAAYGQYLMSGGPRMPLVLAGASGWLMDGLAEYIATLGLTDRVILAGYVPDDELIWLYQNCCAQIYASLFEGSGLPLLEGMQLGAPTIASNKNSGPEITGGAAILVSPINVDGISAALLRVASDETLRADLARRGKERASEYASARIVRQLLNLYARAISVPKRCGDIFFLSAGERVEIPYIANDPTAIGADDTSKHHDEQPILSVVLPTKSAWSSVQATIGPFIQYALAAGIELIVANGENEPTWPHDVRSRVRWLWQPGSDILSLRAAGLNAATTEIVAITEDHCAPRLDWCSRIVATYRAHPDCAAIGGAVANGSENTIMGRANFAVTFARYLPTSLTAPVPAIANMAVRRSALPRKIAAGELEMTFLPDLSPQPGAIQFSPEIFVTHTQGSRPLAYPRRPLPQRQVMRGLNGSQPGKRPIVAGDSVRARFARRGLARDRPCSRTSRVIAGASAGTNGPRMGSRLPSRGRHCHRPRLGSRSQPRPARLKASRAELPKRTPPTVTVGFGAAAILATCGSPPGHR
jgi:glycosyltransferase involved in cell wall biosynthesis